MVTERQHASTAVEMRATAGGGMAASGGTAAMIVWEDFLQRHERGATNHSSLRSELSGNEDSLGQGG